MIIEAFVLSLFIALVRGGKFSRLGKLPIKHAYLFILPLLIFSMACSIATGHGEALLPYIRIANIIQYIGLLAAVGLNLHIRELWIAGVGTFANFLAVVSNGGMMPMSKGALRAAGLSQMLTPDNPFARHSFMSAETNLKFLVDIIPVKLPAFFPSWLVCATKEVASVGDVLIALAVFVLVQRVMCASTHKKESLG